MNNSEKQGLLGISVKIVKVVLCFFLIINAIAFIYFGIINKSDVLKYEDFRFVENWSVVSEAGDYTISTTIPQNIRDNEYLFFDTRKDVAVYINGELRDDFIESRDVNIPGGSMKKFYMMVPLTEADSNAEVKIVRMSELEEEHSIPKSFISTRLGAFNYLMQVEGITFFLASIVCIFSIAVIIVSVVLKHCYKLNIDMMYGALGILIISLWLITDSYIFPFIFGVYHVNGLVSYMLCHMIPFAPAIYLNSLQHGRYKKSMSAMMLVSCAHAIIWPVLNFSGIISYYDSRNYMNVILVLMAVSAIAILVTDAVKGNTSSYRYTFIGFFGFLICCIVALLMVMLIPSLQEPFAMVVGLGFLLTFIVIQQVDDLRKINLEKQRAIDISEAKTRFLASMSHEIRTPINAILGMNEMILRENNDRVVGEYSKNIKSSGKMLLMLVNDVLDFSKIEAGKLEITEARFLMSDMLYDVISLVKERADEKSLELRTELTDEIPNELISDEFRIRQILVNLINNAVKYTDNGTITLEIGGSYTDAAYELILHVKDTGKGIRKEEQEHLFEAFTRADAKSNANIEGTGLGLAIVKSIVDSMNGEVGVESEYGTGSDFWVKLPVSYESKDPLPADFMENRVDFDSAEETSSFTAPTAKVLAVDDNQSNLTIVKLFLKRTGIKPDLVNSGKRAIELCKEKRYDLILLDHMMPEPDGIETLHIIRSDEASLNRFTKAVVLTANAVAGSRQMYLGEGFDDYLTKPLDSKALEQTVKNLLPKEMISEVLTTPDDTETEGTAETETESMSPIKKKLTTIKGLDYEAALGYCGDDEDILEEIIADVASEGAERVERMRLSMEVKDFNAYRIDAHTIKSTMATIGLNDLSDRARKHEFAARDKDTGFIYGDAEEFLKEYAEVCEKLK